MDYDANLVQVGGDESTGGAFGSISSDVVILVFYIILTLLLILVGKMAGRYLWRGYYNMDPGSYPESRHDPSYGGVLAAESDGRMVGSWAGFFLGALLVVMKMRQIYTKVRV